MRVVLGIQEAHDSSAALMIDGEIRAAAQTERFSGLKGDYGYPDEAIEACLSVAGVGPEDIDEVALASHKWNPVLTKIKRNANFSVEDWVKEQHEYWKPTLLKGEEVTYWELFKNREDFEYDDTYPMDHLLEGYMDPDEMEEMQQIRIETVAEELGISTDRIRTVTHEDCHTFYSYFGSPLRGEVLCLTAEGIGDYSNGTVSIFSEDGREELSSTDENHIGHIYQYMTLLLGMKPAQHEYKVMGLAPYANEYEAAKSREVFQPVLEVDGLDIVYDDEPEDLYFHFKDALEGHRFDGIAAGLQSWVEDLLAEWLENCYEETGLGRVVFSGGVAQNIKACQVMMEQDFVEDFFVCPTPGDTTLSAGACYYAMWEHLQERGESTDILQPLEDVYLGPTVDRELIDENLSNKNIASRYEVVEDVTPRVVAEMLANGNAIARCAGRVEFGHRALGNRSIMADPRNPDIARKINSQIKFRDFWMPFSPTILAEREDDYILNPNDVEAPFMTLAFDTTDLGEEELRAALHPADFTVRPQILQEEDNPGYYEIIKEFEALTGVGAVLNTSFNLHGYPIVLGTEEALHVFDNSDLDGLLLEDTLIYRGDK